MISAVGKTWLRRIGRRARSLRRDLARAATRSGRRSRGTPDPDLEVGQLRREELDRYDYARHARWLRRLTTAPHEPEFRAFRHLAGSDGVFVDVGADVGESIVSYRLFDPAAAIVSFEANTLLRPALTELASQDPQLSVHMVALGREPATLSLFIPCVDRRPYPPLASLRAERFLGAAQVAALRELMGMAPGDRFGVCRLQVEVRTLDEYELAPTAIKIDVESWEADVLAGGLATIDRHRPLLLIEEGGRDPGVAELLRAHDYRAYVLDEGDQLVPGEHRPGANGFYLAEARLAEYRRRGLVRA